MQAPAAERVFMQKELCIWIGRFMNVCEGRRTDWPLNVSTASSVWARLLRPQRFRFRIQMHQDEDREEYMNAGRLENQRLEEGTT